jgi:toxin ParE1/3/4
MGSKIIWTRKAASHLEAIHQYISRDSITYASRFIKSLISQTDILKTLPLSGRIVPEFNLENIRELIYKDYRIIYEVKKNAINILAVQHGNRLLEKLFE